MHALLQVYLVIGGGAKRRPANAGNAGLGCSGCRRHPRPVPGAVGHAAGRSHIASTRFSTDGCWWINVRIATRGSLGIFRPARSRDR